MPTNIPMPSYYNWNNSIAFSIYLVLKVNLCILWQLYALILCSVHLHHPLFFSAWNPCSPCKAPLLFCLFWQSTEFNWGGGGASMSMSRKLLIGSGKLFSGYTTEENDTFFLNQTLIGGIKSWSWRGRASWVLLHSRWNDNGLRIPILCSHCVCKHNHSDSNGAIVVTYLEDICLCSTSLYTIALTLFCPSTSVFPESCKEWCRCFGEGWTLRHHLLFLVL